MSRLLVIDLESTGLDTTTARILELGVVLAEPSSMRPLITVGEFFYDETYPKIEPRISELTGITEEMLKEFGQEPRPNLEWLERFAQTSHVSLLCGHNLRSYDAPLLWAELDRNGVDAPYLRSLPLVDTKTDLPGEFESLKLKYMAADKGFINPFSHRAVFDCMTCLKLLSEYDIDQVIANSKKKRITVRALVDYANRQAAKDRKFFWDGDNKQWRKEIFEDQLEAERAGCSFQIGVIDGKN